MRNHLIRFDEVLKIFQHFKSDSRNLQREAQKLRTVIFRPFFYEFLRFSESRRVKPSHSVWQFGTFSQILSFSWRLSELLMGTSSPKMITIIFRLSNWKWLPYEADTRQTPGFSVCEIWQRRTSVRIQNEYAFAFSQQFASGGDNDELV